MTVVRLIRNLPTDPENPDWRWKPGPKCESDVQVNGLHDYNWRKNRYGVEQPCRCTRDAVVEIDGKKYCRLHGGYRALDILLAR